MASAWPSGLPRACRAPVLSAIIPERLTDSTVQAALGFASTNWRGGTARAAAASLAERVLKIMLLTKLSLFFRIAGGRRGTGGPAGIGRTPGRRAPSSDPAKPGPNDLSGRIVNRPALAWRTRQVWAVVGSWGRTSDDRHGKTDGEAALCLAASLGSRSRQGSDRGRSHLDLLAARPDGRIGWLAKVDHSAAARTTRSRSSVGDVGEARGRVTDQNGRPIEGAQSHAADDQPGRQLGLRRFV